MQDKLALTNEQFQIWNINFKDHLTFEEACIYLGVGEHILRGLITKGKIPHVRLSNRRMVIAKADLVMLKIEV